MGLSGRVTAGTAAAAACSARCFPVRVYMAHHREGSRASSESTARAAPPIWRPLAPASAVLVAPSDHVVHLVSACEIICMTVVGDCNLARTRPRIVARAVSGCPGPVSENGRYGAGGQTAGGDREKSSVSRGCLSGASFRSVAMSPRRSKGVGADGPATDRAGLQRRQEAGLPPEWVQREAFVSEVVSLVSLPAQSASRSR